MTPDTALRLEQLFGFPVRKIAKYYLNYFDGLRMAVNRFDPSWAQFGHNN
jgi:hypothetical protein